MQKLLLEPGDSLYSHLGNRKQFFLAGPILGGENWQAEAAEFLWQKFPNCVVIDPTDRPPCSEPRQDITLAGKPDTLRYQDKVSWEAHYMHTAAASGCIIFWLASESIGSPRPPEYGVYGQNTRVEIGLWIEKLRHYSGYKAVFGAATNSTFGGLDFIAHYLNETMRVTKTGKERLKLFLTENLQQFLEKAIT